MTKKRPRVLHITTTLNTGGAQRSLDSLLSGGSADQTDSHVISMTDPGAFGPRIEALGIPVHTLGMTIGKPTFGGLRTLRQLVKDIRPDILQGWMYHGNIAAALAQKVCPGKPALAWNIRHSVHDLAVEKRSTRIAININKVLSGRPDSIIYNSILARQQHEALGYADRTGTVIPNGFDLSTWRPNRQARDKLRGELEISEQARVVGLVARHHPMKDVNNFLRAMRPLMDELPGLHCLLCGLDLDAGNPALAEDLLALPQERL